MDCSSPFDTDVTVSGTIITSPNHPNLYENSKDCQIRILFDDTQRVVIEFLTFNVRAEDCNDWLHVHDGDSSSSPLVRLCGDSSTLPNILYSTGNSLTLVFHSNHYGRESGFMLRAHLGKN